MKNYFKYFFSRTEHWVLIPLMIIVMIIAYVRTDDYASFIFLVPITAMVIRSVIMYKQKKNGTTS